MRKLEGNGLWQSSRMMLLEHRDALVDRQKRSTYSAPQITSDKLLEIAEHIGKSYQHDGSIEIRYFDENGEYNVEGKIVRINQELRKIYVKSAVDMITISLDTILDTSLVETWES